MRALLVPLAGGPPIEITKDLTLVGRKEDCDFRLNHKSVSKMHCVLVKTDGVLLLRDLGSTNGTRVNGQRVRRAFLWPNDQLCIAGHKFRVHLGEAPVPSAVLPHDRTQQLEASEVAQLAHPGERHALPRGSAEVPPPLKPNSLPDVYPDDAAGPASEAD